MKIEDDDDDDEEDNSQIIFFAVPSRSLSLRLPLYFR